MIAIELPDDTECPRAKLIWLEGLLRKAERTQIAVPSTNPQDIGFSSVRCNITRDYYNSAFAKIKRHIFDGDVYQINFSQRFECAFDSPPIDLFLWQNHFNASPYAAYIDAGSFQIVSASPEMFITIDDGVISTRPIKGTRPRNAGAPDEINAGNFTELLNSPKEQAELNMIIDLERNDLARICIPGTRRVVQPRTIETYPTVFHAEATIAGRLREDVAFCDVLRAMFPGGSITGAPKIRAMQIINETEPNARGVYTGGIGYIGLDGRTCLNIAIRTIIISNNAAFVQTGGGIVADSDPDAEYEETITKARALLAGVKAVSRRA
jgi:para-aminobenzoate synthetase component 1